MAGAVIIPRDVIDQLANEPELLALMVLFVSRARYTPGKAAKGTDLEPGQFATGKRAIASQFKWTESKAYRAMTRLQDRNLIELKANREGTIVTLCNSERYRRFSKKLRTASEPSSTLVRTDSELQSNQHRTPIEKELKKKAPPPTPSRDPEVESGTEGRWGEVGSKLRERGISCVEDAVATADTRGLTPAEVLDLIDEWDRSAGAHGPGALFQRITGQLRAWPPAAPEFERARAREGTLKSHEANVAKRAAGRQSRDDDTQLLADLDAKHGATIAAMTADEVVAALGSSHLAGIYRSRGVSGLVRDRLYDVLENAAGATTGAIA